MAAALCGNCGLHVPASRAQVPRFDAFMMRMSSSDSPLEGKSHFAVEMADANTIIYNATARSVVMVDELCRGTEPSHGASIAGSILADLDTKGVRGFFSTHLHKILDLMDQEILLLPNTKNFCMEVEVRTSLSVTSMFPNCELSVP
jgi:DNA mismatch repair ATPase MutS